MTPANLILEGVVGSHAHGLAHQDSDEDLKGVFLAQTSDILSLNPPPDTLSPDDDTVYYEVEKFLKLALKANPTILELLFLDDYKLVSDEARQILNIKRSFLSERARNTYGGYLISSLKLMQKRLDNKSWTPADKRYKKNARAMVRILLQGKVLLKSGNLIVKVTDTERVLTAGALSPGELADIVTRGVRELDSMKSVLPSEPDAKAVNEVLLDLRKGFWAWDSSA